MRRSVASLAAYAVLSATAPGCAGRTEPGVVLPTKATKATKAARDRSRGETDRGDVEIVLGAVTTGVAATLVVLGAYSLYRGQELQRYCSDDAFVDAGQSSICNDVTGFDPVRGARISGGLALALSVPIAVGGGMLLRKGVRIRRDWLRQRIPAGLSLRPWIFGRAAGVDLGFRF